ncbi:MAG: hypothetical protein AAF915_03995 [Cyanobacteria bacterium P01_D01_bin.50]
MGNKTTSGSGNRGSSQTAILEEDVIFTVINILTVDKSISLGKTRIFFTFYPKVVFGVVAIR